MKKPNNVLGKVDYFSSIDKLADDFAPKERSPLSVGNYDYIGAFKPRVQKNYDPYKQQTAFLPAKKRFDPYENTWGRQVQKTLHVGPAQEKELNKKQLVELIHELKEKKIRAKKAEEDAREIHTLSKRFMNKPWSAVPQKYRAKYGRMDFDGDGVKNSKDCYPFDYDRQGWLEDSFKGIYDFFVPPTKPITLPQESLPVVDITVGDKGKASDVVWAGNIAASIAQATVNPDVNVGNQGIAGAINAANAAGANVIIGGKPISQVTNIGGQTTGGNTAPTDRYVSQAYADEYKIYGDEMDSEKYNKILQDISDAKFKDPKLAAQLEAKLKPFLDAYKAKESQLESTLKAQSKGLSNILDRKNEQMSMIGGINLANKKPYARAQEILNERLDRFQSAADAAKKLEMDAYSKQESLLNKEHNRAIQDAITADVKARADEYTKHNVVIGTIPYTNYKDVLYSTLTPIQKAEYDSKQPK